MKNTETEQISETGKLFNQVIHGLIELDKKDEEAYKRCLNHFISVLNSKDDRNHLKFMNDMDLRNEIDSAKHVLNTCVDYAQMIANDEEADLEPLEGLYFASFRYRELVEEMDRRFCKLVGHKG